MRVGIIGVGMIGGALARHLARLGHDVRIANSRHPDTLRDLARDVGARAVSVPDAARDIDLLVISIPYGAVRDLPRPLFADTGAGPLVIDTNNYYPSRDGRNAEVDAGMVESGWVAQQVGRPVVKAFNNLGSASLAGKAAASGSPDRLALPAAGDSPEDRATVLRLIDEIGFDPIDAGPLVESWRQQPGTPAYGREMTAPQLRQALAEADHARLAEYREAADAIMRPYVTTPRRPVRPV